MFLLRALMAFVIPIYCHKLTVSESNIGNGEMKFTKRSTRSIRGLNVLSEEISGGMLRSQKSSSHQEGQSSPQSNVRTIIPDLNAMPSETFTEITGIQASSPRHDNGKAISQHKAEIQFGRCEKGHYILPSKFAVRQSEFRTVEEDLLEILNSPELHTFQRRREVALKVLRRNNLKIGAKALDTFLLCHNLGPAGTPIVPSGFRQDSKKGSVHRYKKGDRKLMAELVIRIKDMKAKTVEQKAEYARNFFEAHGFHEPHDTRVYNLLYRCGMLEKRPSLVEQRHARFS